MHPLRVPKHHSPETSGVSRVDPEHDRFGQCAIGVVDPSRQRDVLLIEPPCHESRDGGIPHMIAGGFRLRQPKDPSVLTGVPRVTSAAASQSSGNSPSKLVVCPRKEPQ